MSKAEELLNTLDAGSASQLALNGEEPHIVIGADRYITVPDQLKRIAVQYDHDIETVTFDCPRYWDEHDMSTMSIYINYLCPNRNSGVFPATNVKVSASDSSIMQFDWTISKNVTMAEGKLTFLVCVKNADSDGNEKNHWNSELCTDCYISKGLEINAGAYEDIVPDFIAQWQKEVLDATNSLYQQRDNGEFDGATFTPMVNSTTGVISWTNNKGKANPTPVNIKGPAGVSPSVTVTDIQGGHKVTITDADASKSFDVMDTIINTTDAVNELMDRFVTVGNTQPTVGPALWFDTAEHSVDSGATLKYLNTNGIATILNPDSVSESYQATTNDGVTYNVTIPGFTDIKDGVTIIINPTATNTSNEILLNVNNTTPINVTFKRVWGKNPGPQTVEPMSLKEGIPINLMYSAYRNVWIADLVRVNANDLAGILPIDKGGTGAIDAEDALINLGLTATAAELNYTDGVTSNIQTQLNGKANVDHTHAVSSLIGVSASAGELSYTKGVTSNIQTQLNGKANSSHSHSTSDITSGVLSTVNGGTGTNSVNDARAIFGIQSGTATIEYRTADRNTSSVSVTFTKSFTHKPSVVVQQVFDNNNIVVLDENITTTGFTAQLNSGFDTSGTRKFSWIAIGDTSQVG